MRAAISMIGARCRLAAQLSGGLMAIFSSLACADQSDALTELSMEELLGVQVYAASRFQQKTTEAPAAVTIITAADIRDFGYRTLADVLRSVRGIHLSYDRNYTYLGVRGFGRTGDYNGRVLLLVDGHRLNDPIYDTAAIGTEFPLDLDIVERVEVVRGPGSSVYGSNAFFGIVNVITRRGRDVAGVELAASVASFGTDQERLTWGGQGENGAEWLLSATRYRSAGQDHFYPEFGATANDLDRDHYDSLFGKLGLGPWTLTAAWTDRSKKIPTAAWDTVFNDPNHETNDASAYVDLAYSGPVRGGWELAGRVFYGHYSFDGDYPYIYSPGDPVTVNKDRVRASWWGGEVKLMRRYQQHTLVLGAEYQDNAQQDQANFDAAPYALYLDDRRTSTRGGVYLQDEMALASGWLLNAGLRYDDYSAVGSTLNPRLGLIWNPQPATTFKLLYGTAFRAPNAYELYYAVDPQKANPDVKPEKIRSYELVAEHSIAPDFRVGLSIYHNHIDDLVEQVVDPDDGLLVFRNSGAAEATGVEVEAERMWNGGRRLRASYAWQHAVDAVSDERLVNSPRHLLKFNYSAPLFASGWRGGTELLYTDDRATLAGGTAAGYWLANMTVVHERLVKNLIVSMSAYNLFNADYAFPGGPEHIHESGAALDQIPADGRSYRFKLQYRF